MAKLVEMVKNSPLVKRRTGGGYQVLDREQKDPFAKGITFTVHYYASAEVEDNHNTPAVQETVRQICVRKPPNQLRKTILTVKGNSLSVTDTSTKQTDNYPIFLVAYCGGHQELTDCFYFIHKTPLDRKMRVEVFKCSSSEKVKALTITVAKAFNIAYKAWVMEKKKKERAANGNGKGSESPATQRRALPKSTLTKIAPGIATGKTYTPPVTRKPPSGPAGEEPAGRSRSGSHGDKPLQLLNPAVVRAMAVNDVTGSTHNVTLSDDFDREFQELAESRAQPEVLRTSYAEDETDQFSLDKIMALADISDDN